MRYPTRNSEMPVKSVASAADRWVPDGLDVSRGRRAGLMGFGLGGSDRVAGVGAWMCVRDVGWRRFLGPGGPFFSRRVGLVAGQVGEGRA